MCALNVGMCCVIAVVATIVKNVKLNNYAGIAQLARAAAL